MTIARSERYTLQIEPVQIVLLTIRNDVNIEFFTPLWVIPYCEYNVQENPVCGFNDGDSNT
ncbi:hypothetical protein Glove_63g72 [Diversispora epigaea]|uniref:Uncharacterized protein n=1 Tax=Diversispora epigaea TaxID=1348612 RepID=A0A397JKB3_9GLOM|nr:hypothetical protein Glove_63g72 [Diversispora epigaea]